MFDQIVTVDNQQGLENISQENLQLGDKVVLQMGEIAPADLHLVEGSLLMDEFELTGEILPVTKEPGKEENVYMGSKVLGGHGKAVVVALREKSEFGKVLKQEAVDEKPLKYQVMKGKYLILVFMAVLALFYSMQLNGVSIVIVATCVVISILLLLLQNDDLFKQILISGEISKLKKENILVRSWKSLLDMRNVDLICFDKTGVLTTREMQVKGIHFPELEIFSFNGGMRKLEENTRELVVMACALCNGVFYPEKLAMGNPVDAVLLKFAQDNGLDLNWLRQEFLQVFEKSFDSDNRYMESGYRHQGKILYLAKGDPDVILNKCAGYRTGTGFEKKLDSNFWRRYRENLQKISQDGDRGIALAYVWREADSPSPEKYTFLCLLQLSNPMKPAVPETIDALNGRSIRSMMLTGDRAETARSIGVMSGISRKSKFCLDGQVMQRMELDEIGRQSDYCAVFCRLTPSQKGVLIRLFQRKGYRVAMLGDGANDGLALKAADIGVSFSAFSSPVAKSLATILIQDIPDLLLLIDDSNRLQRNIHLIKIIRIMIICLIFLGIILWFY